MLTARLARKLLALTIAYAMVLAGVAGPVLGHGFDSAQEFCNPSGPEAARDRLPRSPETPSHPDCCLALCGGLAAILPPVTATPLSRPYASRVAFSPAPREAGRQWHASHFARAPPAG